VHKNITSSIEFFYQYRKINLNTFCKNCKLAAITRESSEKNQVELAGLARKPSKQAPKESLLLEVGWYRPKT